MTIDEVGTIGVIGSGTMGSQIALQCALHGYPVLLFDSQEGQIERALRANRAPLERRVKRGELAAADLEAVIGRIQPQTTLAATAAADFLIEAVPEQLALKQAVFAALDDLARPEVVRASNSSTIVISQIAGATRAFKRSLNVHFFHPVLVMKLVEVVPGPATDPDAIDLAIELVRRIGREPVRLDREIDGFIVNRVLMRIIDEALALAEGGYASVPEIDKAIKLGLNHPMGPFELMDFSGLDVVYDILDQRFKRSGDPADRPPALLQRLVDQGQLGRKSGQGFYTYDQGKAR